MAELLTTPPPARTVWEFLASVLDVPAVGRIPNPRPDTFVRVRTGGGSIRDIAAAQATVFVECYANTIDEAEALSRESDAHLAKAGIEGWLLDVPVRAIQVVSLPQELPDPLTDQVRFTATYAPILHRTAVTVP